MNSKHMTGIERSMKPEEIIVTKTDLSGKITYGNRTFFKFADYTEAECLGVQHNLVRHPEMPRSIFYLAWQTIKAGEELFAYINNRSKNGDFYWVFAHMTPSFDAGGGITGYHSNRRAPNKTVIKDSILPLYRELLAIERASGSPKDGMEKAADHVRAMLDSGRTTFNKYTLSLGA